MTSLIKTSLSAAWDGEGQYHLILSGQVSELRQRAGSEG